MSEVDDALERSGEAQRNKLLTEGEYQAILKRLEQLELDLAELLRNVDRIRKIPVPKGSDF